MPPSTAPLLGQIEGFVSRYVVFPNHYQRTAVTLWIAYSHFVGQAETTRYLAVTSAEKRRGKIRVLDVLELLLARPWRVIQPTGAVLFHKVAQDAPTLVVDEIDTIYGPMAAHHDGHRALLNPGNRASTK